MPPSKARRKRSLRDITATVATGPVANSKPGSSSTNEGKQQDKKKEGPQEPDIPPLPPVVVNIVPRQGLGCEVVEGLLVPSRKREYKPNSKYTVGNHPIYAIGFNFIDMRYYDVFAIASCNSVSSRLLPTSCLLSFYPIEVWGVLYGERKWKLWFWWDWMLVYN
jgi:polycomb protein EED